MSERQFPILGSKSVRSIPWARIAPHEAQARANHGQTLERLAERGGLSPVEAVAVMTGKPLPRRADPKRDYEDALLALIAHPAPAQPASAEQQPVYGIFDPDYARVFTIARCLARTEGYALAMHGSFTRDLDLLAVPWTDHACEADHLVARIADACKLKPIGGPPSDKPHGRRAWTLLFPEFGDPRFIDLSVMPRAVLKKEKA